MKVWRKASKFWENFTQYLWFFSSFNLIFSTFDLNCLLKPNSFLFPNQAWLDLCVFIVYMKSLICSLFVFFSFIIFTFPPNTGFIQLRRNCGKVALKKVAAFRKMTKKKRTNVWNQNWWSVCCLFVRSVELLWFWQSHVFIVSFVPRTFGSFILVICTISEH